MALDACRASLSSRAAEELRGFALQMAPRYDAATCGAAAFLRAARALRARREMAAVEKRLLSAEPGVAVVEGLRPEGLPLEALKLAVAALSAQLGDLLPQGQGLIVKEVKDRGLAYGREKTTRYSDTNRGGNYHTDGAEIPDPIRYFPFYCVRQAAEGGVTKWINAYAVHNRLRESAPRALARLYEPFLWDRRGDLGPRGEKTFEKPVFRLIRGRLRCDYLRFYIEEGYRVEGRPVPADAAEALDAMDRVLYDPGLAADVLAQPGELLLSNNFFTIHGRSEFKDAGPDAGQRLFLRCWVRD